MIYAKTEDTTPDYVTAGKRYELTLDDGEGFEIEDDQGDIIYCLWKDCAHLSGGNWTRIED